MVGKLKRTREWTAEGATYDQPGWWPNRKEGAAIVAGLGTFVGALLAGDFETAATAGTGAGISILFAYWTRSRKRG